MKRGTMMAAGALVALSGCGLAATAANAQAFNPNRVEVAWNRYYDYTEIVGLMQAFAREYPDLVELRQIGTSREGRPMFVAIVTNPETGAHDTKPAMWIDGNVHGNEIQASEMVLYSLWYLTKEFGETEDITELLSDYSVYLLPSQNPDGRQAWFDEGHTSSSSRGNRRPVDNDNDGLVDEDHYDDLDGDGSITQMWKEDPSGEWRRNADDPRIFERVEPGQTGGWSFLGFEGIDNDGDGRINEDPIGGDDMNRNWPSDWLPDYIQRGAGLYPFSNPETRAIGEFILAHPNIAGVQSFHNSGGMILRGPGASYLSGIYPPEDVRVYDEIGAIGEKLLPYYDYMIIYRDLYTVHGGFVNWTAEGLGVFSFTNELWTAGKYFQRDVERPSQEDQWLFRDRLQFGQVFKDFAEYEHPEHGTILLGGLNKWSSRNTPTFMLEEEAHRNFGFTMLHASSMPRLAFGRTEVERLADGLWQVTVEVANNKPMPTRSGIARRNDIGAPDVLTCEGGSVVAGGTVDGWVNPEFEPVRHEPARLVVNGGVPGRDAVIFRFLVEGDAGDTLTLRYAAEKAMDIETTVTLTAD
jgi:hypothetical protein